MSDKFRFYSWPRAVEVATEHAHSLGHARIVAEPDVLGRTHWVLTFDGKVPQ